MGHSCIIDHPSHVHDPLIFDQFFDLGKEDTASPFLRGKSRSWGAHLNLKSSILAAVLLLLSFILSWSPTWLPLSYLLLVAVYFLAGIPSLISSIEDLIVIDVNIDVLMTLAAFSSVLIGSGMEGGLLLVLFALSGSMEEYVSMRAKGAISSLHQLSPTKACVVNADGSIIDRSIRDVQIGNHILIKAGQIVPLDGTVISGISTVNLVHLTGENLPVVKKIGDMVPAGARNMEGTLTVQVSHTSSDSTLSKIIQLVTQAQEERPTLQRWFDKLSKSYAIAIISLSAAFAVLLPLFTSLPYLGVEGSVYRALAFLIAASPCALIIAIPIAYLSAIGVCAKQGILLKGGLTLDALAQCKVMAFDKTGTLTTGELLLNGIEEIGVVTVNDHSLALAIAFSMEKHAVHPIAKAVVAYGQEKRLPHIKIEEFRAIPGYGLEGVAITATERYKVIIGQPEYIASKCSKRLSDAFIKKAADPQERGELITAMLIGEQLYLLSFNDTLRPHIKETITELRETAQLKLLMLTGDHENSARRIANELKIDDYRANLRPEDKLRMVGQIASEEGLAMIGDGINDAPALARATVGICMGKIGSTAAIDAADVILLHDNIEKLGWLRKKALQTQKIVKQNLILATAAIVIASIPALLGFVPLWLAVVMHEGGTILVGLNGLRLIRK